MGKQKKFYQYVGVQAAIIVAIGGIIVETMHIVHNRSKLAQDNDQYKTDIADLKENLSGKDSEIQRLETQLTPFKTIALGKYTGSEQEALRKLAQELEDLKNYVNPLKKPIAFATAEVEVTIKSDEQVNTRYMNEGGYLAFVENRQSVLLTSNTQSIARQNGKGEVVYRGNFNMQTETSSIIGKPVETLQTSDIIQIVFLKIPDGSEVISGKATVIINGDMRFEFEISPLQMKGDKIFILNIKDKFLTSQFTGPNGFDKK